MPYVPYPHPLACTDMHMHAHEHEHDEHDMHAHDVHPLPQCVATLYLRHTLEISPELSRS